MLSSIATAVLLVLPILWLAVLSMLGNELSAIRDMGIAAADLLLLPALCQLLQPKRGRTDYCRKIGSTPF